jgi:hypothetical protein
MTTRTLDEEIIDATREILDAWPESKPDGIRGPDLLQLLRSRFPGRPIAPRRYQEAVAELAARGIPAYGTEAQGYRIAKTEAQLEAGARVLKTRIGSLNRRLVAFDRAGWRRVQTALFPEAVAP